MPENFVIDNSVIMSWCFKDETSQYSDNILEKLTVSMAVVPSIWPLEIANVLLEAERKNRLGEADSARFITLINKLPIKVEQETPERMLKEIFALAREYDLSSYDASYLDLAMRNGLPIATLDEKLRIAAQKSRVTVLDG